MTQPPFVISSTSVAGVLGPLAYAVSDALASTSAGRPGRVALLPGTEVSWDGCDCGSLSVRVLRRYRTRRFPVDFSDQVIGNCNELGIVVECAMLLLRCSPVVGESDIDPPTVAALTRAMQDEQEDAFIVWDTTQCYLNTLANPAPGHLRLIDNFIINDQVSIGPMGGCSGTELHFKIGFYVNCGCG